MKKYVAIILSLVFSSCLKHYIDELPQEEQDDQFIVSVPQDFNWSSIEGAGIEVTIKHNSEITYALDSTLIELYDEDDDLLDALTIYDGMAEFNIRIPSSISVLKLKSVATNVSKEFTPASTKIDLNIPDLSVLSFARKDRDRDGLFDEFDAFPDDGNKTIMIDNYNQSSNLKSGKKSSVSSYVIFEDLWPSKGDYDFNDLVAKTTFSWERGKSNYIEEISGVCDVEWIGAGIGLGLGFELFETKGTNLYYMDDIIKEVSGGDEDNSVTNGFILFSKVQSVGTNQVHFTIKLKDKALKNFLCVPYLFRTNDKGHQVRPFGAPPTESQKMSLFRSADDKSPVSWTWTKGKKFKYPIAGNEAFYKSGEQHPWGIEFISKKKFKPSKEGRTIIRSYPKFRTWAESGGKKESSWYEYPE